MYLEPLIVIVITDKGFVVETKGRETLGTMLGCLPPVITKKKTTRKRCEALRESIWLVMINTFNILSDECVSTKLGVTENFVSSLYLLIQSSTLKKCIEHCLTALATLSHVSY